MPNPDTSWQSIATAVNPGNAAYAVVGVTPATLSPLNYDQAFWDVQIDGLGAGAPTVLLFRVKGTMADDPETALQNEFSDVLASFPDTTDNDNNVFQYILDAAALLALGSRFRIRIDERWKGLQLEAQSDVADIELTIQFRRA